MQNYFELLKIDAAFNLDAGALQQAYIRAQQQCHPDRMVGKSEAERAKAMQLTMDVNQAYETLKSPRRRAEHLLALQGIRVNQDDKDAIRPDQSLLMEVMAWQEAIAEGETDTLLPELEAQLQLNEATIAEHLEVGAYQDAAQATIRQRYLEKSFNDANHAKPQLRA